MSDCQVAVAPVLAPFSFTKAAPLDATLAAFQFALATTPAVSVAAIGVPVPTKSILMAAAGFDTVSGVAKKPCVTDQLST